MPQLTLNIRASVNTRQALSVEDLKRIYFAGLDMTKNGVPIISDSDIEFWIQSAKDQVEQMLTIKLDKQIIEENKDFYYDDWTKWGMVKSTYPVVCPINLWGYIGTVRQVNYPRPWLTSRKTTDGQLYSRLIHVVPNDASSYSQAATIYTGILPNIGWLGGGRQTPNYWTLRYVTGFERVPADILQAIGMIAAMQILAILSDSIMGNRFGYGLSSKSISLDGLSQSVSTFANGQAGIFGARLKQYNDMLFNDGAGLLKRLSDYYGAFIWTSA